MALSVVFGLLATRLLYTQLGASRFGLLTALGSAGLLTVFLADALASAAQRDLAHALGTGDLDAARRMMGTGLRAFPLLALALAALGLLAWPLVASWLAIEPDTLADARGAYIAAIATLALTCAATPFRALLVAGQSLWLYTLGDLALAVARLVSVAGVGLIVERPLTGVGIVLFAGTTVAAAGNALLCRMHHPALRGAWRVSARGYARRLLGLAGWTSLSDLAWQAQLQGSAVAINAGFGNAVSAGFAASQQVTGYQASITYGIAFAARPAIVQLEARNDRDAARTLILASSKYAAFAGALFSVPIACEARFWLKTWLTQVPVDGEVFLPILLAWRWVLGMGLSFDSAVLATRKLSRYVTAIVAVQSVFLLALVCSIASGRVPARWCVATLLAGAIVQLLVVHVRIGGRRVEIDLGMWWRGTGRPASVVVSVGIGVALAVRSVLPEGWIRALASGGLACAAMLACAWLVMDSTERSLVRRAAARLQGE